MSNTASLKQVYAERIAPALMKKFNYSSKMQIPVRTNQKSENANKSF